MKLHIEGEALSNDEVMEYLRQQEQKRKDEKKGVKTGKKGVKTGKKGVKNSGKKGEKKGGKKGEKVMSAQKDAVTQKQWIAPEDPIALDEVTTESDSGDEDTSHCFKCSGVYHDSEAKEWIGCDTCYRWYHYKCVGFKRLPKESTDSSCHLCH